MKRAADAIVAAPPAAEILPGPLDLCWFGLTEQPDTGLKRGHDMQLIRVTDGKIEC